MTGRTQAKLGPHMGTNQRFMKHQYPKHKQYWCYERHMWRVFAECQKREKFRFRKENLNGIDKLISDLSRFGVAIATIWDIGLWWPKDSFTDMLLCTCVFVVIVFIHLFPTHCLVYCHLTPLYINTWLCAHHRFASFFLRRQVVLSSTWLPSFVPKKASSALKHFCRL